MVIRLHSIEAVNFRSLGDVTFTPLLDERLTAIVGSNGTGKSSLVTGLVWALYGVTPAGVNVRDLRRQGTTSADECRVTVTFEHNGQTITVTRQLKGSKDATVASITVDGMETTASSVRAANDWVTNRLGLDADGFLAAVLVQQKQVDALVTAPPRERRDLVERLARIDKMGEAATAARKAALEAQRVLDAMPGSDQDVVDAQNRLADADVTLDEAAVRLEKATANASDAVATFDELDALARRVAAALNARKTAEDALSEAQNTVNVLSAQEPGLRKDVDRLTGLAQSGDADGVAAAEKALAAAEAEVAALTDTVQQAKDSAWKVQSEENREQAAATAKDNAERAVERSAAVVAGLRSKITAAQDTLDRHPADVDARVARLMAQVGDLSEQVGAARGEYERLGAAIAALRGSHDPTCPTCAQPIHNHDTLIRGLETDRETVKQRGTALRADLDAASKELSAAREEQAQVTTARADIDRLTSELQTAEAEERQARATLQDKDTELTSATAARIAAVAMSNALTKQAEQAAQRRASIDMDALRDAVRAAESAEQAAVELIDAQDRLTGLLDKITQAEGDVERARTAVAAVSVPSAEEQDRIRADWRAASDAKTATAEAAAEERGNLRAAETVKQQAADALTLAKQQKKARLAAAADYERKVATRDALEAFRKDRLNRLAPELAEVASDLVNRMTNGKYVAVRLDEDFTPTVTDDSGHDRPVSWLSGGEESLVALALRIAIGDVVFGATGGLLFLDEVLSAMDEFRRDATISAVRELPGRQIIMINHIPEAADVGDLVLRVVPTPDGSALEPVDKDGENVHLDMLGVGE